MTLLYSISCFIVFLQLSQASLRGGRDLEEIGKQVPHHISLDPKTVQIKADFPQAARGKSRRKFIRYESSKLEQIWLDNVDRWAQKKSICQELNSPGQLPLLHDFLTLTCSARYTAPYDNWCIIDDEYRPLWYNTANRTTYQFSWINPVPNNVPLATAYRPIVPGPEHEHVVSKFVFQDETNGEIYHEYIEPLVSHLRFPLSHCAVFEPANWHDPYYAWHAAIFKGWVIPPPPELRVNKKLYWDAGASDWNAGMGGPSLKFFYNMWSRHGTIFDEIYAYEIMTPVGDFYKTVPTELVPHVHYEQCAVVSKPEDETPTNPFIPNAIKRVGTPDDYILFKLDIDSPKIEHGTIDYILNDPDNYIDEIVWEHHIAGNYLMTDGPISWGPSKTQAQITLRESYDLFLRMRMKGIRAHSWV